MLGGVRFETLYLCTARHRVSMEATALLVLIFLVYKHAFFILVPQRRILSNFTHTSFDLCDLSIRLESFYHMSLDPYGRICGLAAILCL